MSSLVLRAMYVMSSGALEGDRAVGEEIEFKSYPKGAFE